MFEGLEGNLGGDSSPFFPGRPASSRFLPGSRLGLFRLLFAFVSALFLLDQQLVLLLLRGFPLFSSFAAQFAAVHGL